MIRGTESMDQPVERPRGLSRRLRVLLVAAAALVLLAVLLAPAAGRWWRAERSVDRARLRLATAERGDLERDVAAEGRVVAASYPRLFSPEQGIVSLAVRAGEVVAAGQRLATVESPELAAELRRERSSLESLRSELARQQIDARQQRLTRDQEIDRFEVRAAAAERELERYDRLADDGLVNQVDHDRARDELALARLELQHARQSRGLEREALAFERKEKQQQVERQQIVLAELERRATGLAVTAPFDGMVATVEVQDRDAVERNQPLLTVVDLAQLELAISVPEAFADEVAPGTPAQVVYDGREWPGKVISISPEVTGGQVEGRVELLGEPPPGLKQNQRLSTRLVLERRRAVVKVPRGPFLESGGGRKIYVLADGLATLRDIETGTSSVAEVEVVAGLQPGEVVLLTDVTQFNGARTVLVRE